MVFSALILLMALSKESGVALLAVAEKIKMSAMRIVFAARIGLLEASAAI